MCLFLPPLPPVPLQDDWCKRRISLRFDQKAVVEAKNKAYFYTNCCRYSANNDITLDLRC